MGCRKSGSELTIALFLFFAAMVLLICVSTGPVLWSKMSFMDINVLGYTYHCGVWGYTGQPSGLGYIINGDDVGLPGPVPWQNVSPAVLQQLSGALILHMLAAIFAFLTLVCGIASLLCRPRQMTTADLEANRAAAVPKAQASTTMVVMGLFTFFLCLGAMSVDIALWVGLYKAYGYLQLDGASSSLGVAFWLTLAALVALFAAAFPWQVMVGSLIALWFVGYMLILMCAHLPLGATERRQQGSTYY